MFAPCHGEPSWQVVELAYAGSFEGCYGSPADEHVIQPQDAGIMVEIVNAVSAGVRRPIQFFHLPPVRTPPAVSSLEAFRTLASVHPSRLRLAGIRKPLTIPDLPVLTP